MLFVTRDGDTCCDTASILRLYAFPIDCTLIQIGLNGFLRKAQVLIRDGLHAALYKAR